MLKWIGGVVGFFLGVVGCGLAFLYLFTHGYDAYHTYIVKPSPPPLGYRSIFDVPTADWPNILGFGIALLFGRLGWRLGKRRGVKSGTPWRGFKEGEYVSHIPTGRHGIVQSKGAGGLVRVSFSDDESGDLVRPEELDKVKPEQARTSPTLVQ
jgi:hypothetical protein